MAAALPRPAPPPMPYREHPGQQLPHATARRTLQGDPSPRESNHRRRDRVGHDHRAPGPLPRSGRSAPTRGSAQILTFSMPFDKRPRAPHHAAPRCENDDGGRFTLRPADDSHRRSRLYGGLPTSCGTAAGCAVAHRRRVPWRERPPAPRAWCGIEASVFSHPRPRLPGVAPAPTIRAGRPFSAASRRRSKRSPSTRLSERRASPSPRDSPDEPLWSDATGRSIRP